MLALATAICLGALIWYLGSGRFGRNQTQGWIDRLRSQPKVWAFLDRHHGKFRASAHYFEFGGLFLVLYWCWESWFGTGAWDWNPARGAVIAVACAVAAYLDEVHQLKSGTRQFRRVDFLHSLCGIAIAALIVSTQDAVRFFVLW